jgi:hypothetical protein
MNFIIKFDLLIAHYNIYLNINKGLVENIKKKLSN